MVFMVLSDSFLTIRMIPVIMTGRVFKYLRFFGI